MRHHTPPLSATQLTVDLRFRESFLRMYKSSCWWSSGTKCHDHRESFILLKGQRLIILLQRSCYALGVHLISSSLEGRKLFWKGNKKDQESHEGPSSHVFSYVPASCWTTWPSSKLALQERHTLSRAFLSDGLPPDQKTHTVKNSTPE